MFFVFSALSLKESFSDVYREVEAELATGDGIDEHCASRKHGHSKGEHTTKGCSLYLVIFGM